MTNREEGSSRPERSLHDHDGPELSRPDWKRYPYPIVAADPALLCPLAEGDSGAESNSYYVAGRLRGRETGREWAFLVIFAMNDVWHRLRADFYTLALFDLATGTYGTFTELDMPRFLSWRRSHRLSIARGKLDVTFRSTAGRSSWRTCTAADGDLVPFQYHLDLFGRDANGRRMHLDLDLEPGKPPLPVGGDDYEGRKTCLGQQGTYSYFQSDVRFSGTLQWGDVREEVTGGPGWIDRQFAPRYFGVHGDRRSSRYRHEWRQIHLDNGLEMSVWLQFDRLRANRVVPFSGVTAADAAGRVAATTEFTVEPLSFVRDPGTVRSLHPLTSSAAYLVDRYRLRVPGWGLDLLSEPLVPNPAHRLPIEYWSGPTSLAGNMDGKPVRGVGFHERTRLFSRDFELVEVLRESVRHLPESALPEGMAPPRLANLVWEIDGFLGHRDHEGALRHLRRKVRPELERLQSPERDFLLTLADDLAASLYRWWVRG